MARLAAEAKDRGLTPQRYAKQLILDGLAIQRDAERMSFARLMGPVRKAAGKVDDAEIVALVDKARGGRHRNGSRRGKR